MSTPPIAFLKKLLNSCGIEITECTGKRKCQTQPDDETTPSKTCRYSKTKPSTKRQSSWNQKTGAWDAQSSFQNYPLQNANEQQDTQRYNDEDVVSHISAGATPNGVNIPEYVQQPTQMLYSTHIKNLSTPNNSYRTRANPVHIKRNKLNAEMKSSPSAMLGNKPCPSPGRQGSSEDRIQTDTKGILCPESITQRRGTAVQNPSTQIDELQNLEYIAKEFMNENNPMYQKMDLCDRNLFYTMIAKVIRRELDNNLTENKDVDIIFIEDDDEKIVKVPEKKPKFVLPSTYDLSDSKWTLKYRNPEPNLIELVYEKGVFIDARKLAECTTSSKDYKQLARKLLVQIFSNDALEVCSWTGGGKSGKSLGHNDSSRRPALDQHARDVLLMFVERHGWIHNWGNFNKNNVINSLRNKLCFLRSHHKTK